MKYIAIIDADEKPVSCEFMGCNGNVAPYLIGATTNIKALEQESILDKYNALLEKTYDDFCNCEGGEGWLKIDGKEYSTDATYAIDGMRIFMEIFKRRLAESEEE